MRCGTIFGIAVRIHACFFLVAALFCCAGLIKETAAVFISVLLHEFGHAWAARRLGYTVGEVELLPFGGVAKVERFGDFAPRRVFLTAAAGPAASAALAAAAFSLAAPEGGAWRMAGQVNLLLAAFNLLPAFPLDGAQMSRALLARVLSHRRATRRLIWSSWLIGSALLGKAVYDAAFARTANVSLVMLAAFIFVEAGKERRACLFHRVRVMAYKKADLARRGCMALRPYAVRADTPLKAATRLFAPEECAVVAVLNERGEICGYFTEFQVWETLAAKGLSASCGDLLAERGGGRQDFSALP